MRLKLNLNFRDIGYPRVGITISLRSFAPFAGGWFFCILQKISFITPTNHALVKLKLIYSHKCALQFRYPNRAAEATRYPNRTGARSWYSKRKVICYQNNFYPNYLILINTGICRSDYGELRILCRTCLASSEAEKSNFSILGSFFIAGVLVSQ